MAPGLLTDLFGSSRPVVGVIHAPPLPGAPASTGSFEEARSRVRSDAEALDRGGVDGLLLENFGDAPFHPGPVPAETVSCLTALAVEVREAVPELPLGVNVLRNDGIAALAVAAAAGGAFIRVNVLAGARVTDQGVIQGEAHRLLRRRRALDVDVAIFADVDVKHSAPLASRELEDEARDLAGRAGADALIVTGPGTSAPCREEELERVVAAVPGTPVLAGSGVTPDSVAGILERCHGVIVGSALRPDGRAGGPVSRERVRALVRAAAGEAS